MTLRIRNIALGVASLATVFPLSGSHLVAQGVPPAPAPADAVPADFAPATEGMEVMTRGVVHEAFAEVVTDPKPGLVVSTKPPEAIDEVPPEFKPEEEGSIWISGYWVWDDERDDFFWQSGVWRVPPPGMRWVAGYWNAAPGGWQWISGFWVPVEEQEIRYYNAPPASLEAGPSSPSPGDNFFWATGSWMYYDTGYRWQPGYWAPYQENWVWISPRYVWTPAGCIYLPGRWDYRLTRRGCLFAPVYFTQPIYMRPNYVYRPWCALNTSNLFVHLWVRPNYGHFYFGNYYGSNWNNWGVTPWTQYRPYRNCYDPMLTQLQCHYRQQGVNYISRLDGWHNHYASNVSARPPRTWNEQVRIVNNTTINNININKTNITNISNIKQNILAVNLQDSTRRNEMPVKFSKLDSHMQKQAIDLAKETREVRQNRITVERPTGNLPDLAKGNSEKREVGKPNLGSPDPGKPDLGKRDPAKPGERPGVNDQLRLKLPTTHMVDISKLKERQAPPKLRGPNPTEPTVKLPVDRNRNRDGGTDSFGGPKPKGFPPKGKVELPGENLKKDDLQPMPKPKSKPMNEVKKLEPRLPRPQPKLENPIPPAPPPKVDLPKPTPKPMPKFEAPKPPPKMEIPQPKPRSENPMRQPRLEIPQPKVEAPRVKVEAPRVNLETREQPQIKLDIPRNRVQPAPRIQLPKPEGPRPDPRRGGNNKPKEDRKKPE
ncbi:MAG: hypothetical protein K8R36_08460 [Planctomycetales bacterium]|nr:hypothetical protein [Planctomycetales bacterium]